MRLRKYPFTLSTRKRVNGVFKNIHFGDRFRKYRLLGRVYLFGRGA